MGNNEGEIGKGKNGRMIRKTGTGRRERKGAKINGKREKKEGIETLKIAKRNGK